MAALIVGVGNTALGFVGTIISWPLMNYVSVLQQGRGEGGVLGANLADSFPV